MNLEQYSYIKNVHGIKHFEFCFENCETTIIPFQHIASFNIGEITETLSMSSVSAGVERSFVAALLYIRFHNTLKSADIETSLGENAYKRLTQHNDICYLTIKYEDDISRTFGIQWPNTGDVNWDNPRQSHSTRHDCLEITVVKP